MLMEVAFGGWGQVGHKVHPTGSNLVSRDQAGVLGSPDWTCGG